MNKYPPTTHNSPMPHIPMAPPSQAPYDNYSSPEQDDMSSQPYSMDSAMSHPMADPTMASMMDDPTMSDPAMMPPTSSPSMQPPMPSQPAPIMDANGGFTPQWYEQFEDLRDYAPTLSKFQRPEALAKSYASLERLRGYPGIEDTRRMGAFRRSVGLPDRAEDFSLSRPDQLPDELWDEGLATSMAQTAYEYGVPVAAMDALKENYCRENMRHLQHYRQQEEQRIKLADAELQHEWGLDYEDNMSAITSVFARLGMSAGVEVVPLLQHPALRGDTSFRRVLLEVAHALGEAPHREGTSPDSRKEAHRIAHDPSHPLHEAYMRSSHPQHKYANEQYDRHAFGRPIS